MILKLFMLLKPSKSPERNISFRLISHFPNMSMLFEKIILSCLKPLTEERYLIPDYHFGFQNKYSTINQDSRITNLISKVLEENKDCCAAFLAYSKMLINLGIKDYSQNYEKNCHTPGAHLKNLTSLNNSFESYIKNRKQIEKNI